MARDYKQKQVVPKREYKRKSQLAAKVTKSNKGLSFWKTSLLLIIVAIITFLITKSFTGQTDNYPTATITEEASKIAETPPMTEKITKVAELPEKELNKATAGLQIASTSQVPVEKKEIKFSFYKGLAKAEMVVDVEPISLELDNYYYVQIATFRTQNSALREQQRLAQKGHETFISKFSTLERDYYRVRAGPFTKRLTINAKRNELRRLGINTLLIRLKKNTAYE